jgi:hypothetical protein
MNRRAYWARHERCLQETYPRVLARVGEGMFRTLVESYIERVPSTVACIEHAGRLFPDHLASSFERSHHDADLADIARLEWARVQALMAADASGPLDVATLAKPAAGERALRTAPSLSVLRVRPGAWSDSHTTEQSPWVVVWRGNRGVHELEVDDEQGRALACAAQGASLAAVCSEFRGDDAVERASVALMQWVRRAGIVGLED